jgi:hypothetical protein
MAKSTRSVATVEDNPHAATAKARRELGFDPDLRLEDRT